MADHGMGSKVPARTTSALGAWVKAVTLRRSSGKLGDLSRRSSSSALPGDADSALGRSIRSLTGEHRGQSGITPLHEGRDAFAARVLLADAAQHTLDVQYYIWHNDMSGTLMFDALRRAARRGVRVRLLMDDNNGSLALDRILAALDAEPNIEVRLFNPFTHRRFRALGYLTDFPRLNRRMHNKSFTADNQATIVGGRNIGDEYFDADDELGFVDLDVLAVGDVVREVSKDFDRYWSSNSSHPTYGLLTKATRRSAADVEQEARRITKDPKAEAYVRALRDCRFVQQLLGSQLPFEWTRVEMISDDPRKGLDQADDACLLWARMSQLLESAQRTLHVVSPYFVPTRSGARSFSRLASRGVQISVLTNALEATDVAPVHAGYAKWRKRLLRAGITLLELQRDRSDPATPPLRKSGRRGIRNQSFKGSSRASLHAKTFQIDGARVFVGSFNFDPRSTRLNTELGFVIDSSEMAGELAASFDHELVRRAYRVGMDRGRRLQWTDVRDNGETVLHTTEPGTTWWLRLAVKAMSLLPIDWML